MDSGTLSLLYFDVILLDGSRAAALKGTMSCRIHMGVLDRWEAGGWRPEAGGWRLDAGGQRLAGERGMDGWTDRCAEISPCVLQDIIPFVAH